MYIHTHLYLYIYIAKNKVTHYIKQNSVDKKLSGLRIHPTKYELLVRRTGSQSSAELYAPAKPVKLNVAELRIY